MENNKSNLTAVFLLLFILVVSGIMQTKLKFSPQVFMIVFGVITLLSFVQKYKNISRFLFYFLVGTLLSFGVFMTSVFCLNLVFPESNLVEVEGEEKQVMSMLWLWGIPIALLITPFILFQYHKLKKENTKNEILFLVVFIIMTTIIFFKTEL